MKKIVENKKTDGQMRVEFRRAQLKELSLKAREHRQAMIDRALAAGNLHEMEAWTLARVNDIIAGWYKSNTGATELHTFGQWLAEGYAVRRGSKAFVLWAKKRNAKKEVMTDKGEPDEREYDYFPIAYLFSNLQVEPRKPRNDERAEHPQEATPAAVAAVDNGAEASRFEKAFAA